MKNAKNILREICNAHSIDLTYTEAKEALQELDDITSDYWFDFQGMDFRIIHEDDIWDIYVEAIKDITEDCYLVTNEIPSFLAIDWEETAKNCYVDGYAHTFATYDGEELNSGDYYIFRTN